jgi:hypothetical protein
MRSAVGIGFRSTYHFRRNRARGRPMGWQVKEQSMSISAVGEPRIALPQPAASPPGGAERDAAPAEPADPATPSPFARLVHGLGDEVHRGEATVQHAMASGSGGSLGPAELIALQAGVYRYTEAVDLASRLVDHATTGVKTVVQGQ